MKRINKYTVKLVKESGALYDVPSRKISSPQVAAELFEEVFKLSEQPREHFVMFTLNAKLEVVGAHTIHIGAINASIVSPRDVFQAALLNNACSIVVAHNHPSGNVNPSPEDIEVTERLAKAGKLLGVDVVDHVIIGHDGDYLSIKEKGFVGSN